MLKIHLCSCLEFEWWTKWFVNLSQTKILISMLSFTQTKWINCNMGINKCWVEFKESVFVNSGTFDGVNSQCLLNRSSWAQWKQSTTQCSCKKWWEGEIRTAVVVIAPYHIANEVMMHAVVSPKASQQQTYRGRVLEEVKFKDNGNSAL